MCGGISAQPTVSNPALSSAVARGQGLPGSGVAQGSIFSIYGSGLGPSTWIEANQFPLPTNLGGTSVTVTVQGTSLPAIVLGADSTQVNALLPSNTPIGNGTFTVTYDNQTSAPAPIQVVGSAFGIYTFNQQGTGQAIATDANYQVNTIIHVFHPNDYVVLWGTGLGPINGNDAAAPPVGNLPTEVTVYVGNTTANVSYQGRSGCCSGLDQIIFQVPAGVTGCYVPVAVETGGISGNIGNFATIAVADSGDTCTDSVMGTDLLNQLAAGQNVSFGYIRLYDRTIDEPGGGLADMGFATFSQYTPATAGLAQYGVSSGYCAAVDCTYGCGPVMSSTVDMGDASPAQLDAGTLTVNFPPITTFTKQSPPGFYYSFLSMDGRYLWASENYPVTASGGAAVGPFSVSDTSGPQIAATLGLTGISVLQTLPRGSDLVLQWTGGDPALQNGNVTIWAQSYSQIPGNAATILCTAPASTQTFTIPKRVLAALPVTGAQVGLGMISIGQYNTPTSFTASGLTRGIITDIFNNAIWVNFK
jgi:uncharacterized protein (TIGR03437 family)